MSRFLAQLGGADASERCGAVRSAIECRQTRFVNRASRTQRVASASLPTFVLDLGLGIGHHLSIPERLDHGQNAPLFTSPASSSTVAPSLPPFCPISQADNPNADQILASGADNGKRVPRSRANDSFFYPCG